ncbi:type II secretion system GspH family protein [Candidatus Microgenomates bacterium]|nr:type II secretion system GspH family protein [Candidatus Microgenomates bacterium]
MLKRGFTLIEILVVIAIIGILSTLAIISYTGVQKSARDTQRKSDLKQYQNALEVFSNKNGGFYPSETTAGGVSVSSTVCGDMDLSNCPSDPRNVEDSTFDYKYQSNGSNSGVDATNYVFWSKLENTTDYWVVCSDGKVGTKSQSGWANPSDGSCPI